LVRSLVCCRPKAGWPKAFAEGGLGDMGAQLLERYEAAAGEEGLSTALGRLMNYVPCDHSVYPARRRAQRLSYAVWGIIGGQGVDFQPVLEASSAADRLRLALRRMRDVAAELDVRA
jgi:hypothetical protein